MAHNVSQIDNPPPVSIPSFLGQYVRQLTNGLEPPKVISAKMLKESWLMNDELLDEMQGLLPDVYMKRMEVGRDVVQRHII